MPAKFYLAEDGRLTTKRTIKRILDYFDEHYYGGGSTDAAEFCFDASTVGSDVQFGNNG